MLERVRYDGYMPRQLSQHRMFNLLQNQEYLWMSIDMYRRSMCGVLWQWFSDAKRGQSDKVL